jgi:hypothetical protein
MATKPKAKGSRFWRRLRIYFRRFRITVWLIVLAILGALIYLNLVGLPDFLKRPLVARLAERGLDLDFNTLRLHWSRGFIAEQVRFGARNGTNDPALPRFTAREVEFNFKLRALMLGEIQVDSIALRAGKLLWTIAASNAPASHLAIEDIESNLRLYPNDCWVLENFRAHFGGANFFVSGSLTNASALRELPAQPQATEAWPERLRKISEILAQIKFPAPPELRLDINGDARDLRSFDARFAVKAAAVDTAWGRGQEVRLLTRLFPASSNELSRAEISLLANRVETHWANTANFDLKLLLVTPAARPDQVDAAATLLTDAIESPWVTVQGVQLKTSWTHAMTNPVPLAARVEVHADRVAAWLTQAAEVDFSVTLGGATNSITANDALGFWNHLLPHEARWSIGIGRLRSLALQADQVAVDGEWSPPQFSIANLRAQLYQGSVSGNAQLNVVSRELSGGGAADFELRHLLPLLPPADQARLQQFTWATPPKLRCDAALVLPAWTNPAPNWKLEVIPTLRLAGEVAITNAMFRDIHADWVTTHFSGTNLIWELPDLAVGRPEGGLRVRHRANEATGEYYFQLHSTIDPRAVLPLLDPEVRQGFDLCEFSQPPVVDGELWGRWHDLNSLGFRGHIALTNFSFRGEHVDAIVTGLNYTNQIIECLDLRAWSGTQHLAIAGVTADFPAQRTYFTNGFSTFAPTTIAHAIGPMVTRIMEPYHFGQPPVARFNGYTSMHNPHDADIIFEGEGTDFECLNFRVPRFTTQIIWKNNLLSVTNAQGDFYEGKAGGWAHFDFPDTDHAQYAFTVDVTNARLPTLIADVTQKTNSLEGLLSGRLAVTNAWTDNLHSWNGYGYARLRDGLLWELPIFGVLSRPLDSMIPGVGNSRFTDATASFGIGNSVIYSPDLEMRSAAMRLQYRGTVTFDGDISARVIAEPLRDTPVVGSVVSTILSPVARLFAYRIGGTMKEPKSEPIYIPKLLMVPFSPFQSLGELFSPEPAKTESANPPPEPQQNK